MTAKKLFPFIALSLCQFLMAQQDSIALSEVVVTDSQLGNFSNTQNVLSLNDSVLRANRASLAGLLQFNSAIYFKENGTGSGVASPSFRGTTAQQTAVVWNGININSQINGQTDFNTVATSGYNSISVRSGGGGVIYGSSAIGGSVHLNNEVRFGDRFVHTVDLGYGSFNTQRIRYTVNAGSGKFGVNVNVYRNSSDNDYEYPAGDRKNLNAQFENTGLNAAVAYKLDQKNYVRYFGEVYDGERHFALLTPSDTKTKYRDFNLRNLLEWVNVQPHSTSKIRLAYLGESYRYYENLTNGGLEHTTAETAIVKYDFTYRIGTNMLLNAIADYTQTAGRGSDIGKHRREIGSGAVLLSHRVLGKLHYELGVRKEITGNYDSPVLYSAGMVYSPLRFYSIRINGSRNFRIPTFNDLYWTDGGNPELRPESSYQAELGNDFRLANVKFSVTGYYMKITDMIQWLPGTTSLWFPQNVNKVTAYGAEVLAAAQKKFGRHEISFDATYAYTVSENEKTRKQLIYVPLHKATAGVAYGIGKFSAYAQGLFNGEVFTRSDNNTRYNLDAYAVLNAGLGCGLGQKGAYKIAFQVLNALDAEYFTMERRPYPGRNYNVSLILIL